MNTTHSTNAFTLQTIKTQFPFYYHRPAINSRLKTPQAPTQLVFPDGKIAIGVQPPKAWKSTSPDEESELSSSQQPPTSLQNDHSNVQSVAAYLSVPSTSGPSDFTGENFQRECSLTRYYSGWLLISIAFQALWIAVGFSGATLFPFATKMTVVGNSLQRAIYTEVLGLHSLLVVALSYKSSLLLSIYSVMQVVQFFLVLTLCLESCSDLLIVAAFVPIRFLTEELRMQMMPHVVLLHQESQDANTTQNN